MFTQKSITLLLLGSATTNNEFWSSIAATFDAQVIECNVDGLLLQNSEMTTNLAAILIDMESVQTTAAALARSIRAHDQLCSIPIIFFNAPSNVNIDELYELDGIDVVFHPLSLAVLKARIVFFIDLFHKTAEVERLTHHEKKQSTGESDWFTLILNNIKDYAVITMDIDRNVTAWRAEAENITGWTAHDIVGKKIDLMFTPEDRERGQPAIEAQTALDVGRAKDQRWHMRKDGTRFFADGVMVPLKHSDGEIRGLAKIFKDGTQSKNFEEELKASEERYRTLFNSIDEGFALIEMMFDGHGIPIDYRFLDVNRTFEAQTGLASVIGKTARELIPNLEPHWFETYGNVALTGESIRFTEESDSLGRWFSVYATRVGGERSRNVVLLFSDITERKRAEAEREELLSKLQIAHDQMADVFHQAPAFMCTLKGPNHIFDMVNDQYRQLVGWRELDGKEVREALPEVIEQGYIRILDDVFETGKPFIGKDAKVRLQRLANGESEERVVDFVYLPLKDIDGAISGILAHGIDITDRKRAEEDLRRLALGLSEADRRKTEFLATLAHELRNPLAPIQNGLEVLRLSEDNAAAVRRVRGIMQRQVSHMTHLIDDLLDVARITSGKVELKKERVTLATVVASAVETSMPLIESNNHHLKVKIPDHEVVLNIDPARVSQVIGNLLTNAAKYTPKGGHIALSVEVIDQTVELKVIDNGVGIPADQLINIFDMFTQVGRNMSLAQGGLGIGLSLVKHLVQLHDGTIEAKSEGAGLGSTFVISLPLGSEKPESSDNLTSSHDDIHRKNVLRILVADDNEDAALTLSTLLELNEHVTHVVHDGLSALKAVEDLRPDVAVLDIGMPGLTGFEVAERIKKSPHLKNTFLIALTGWGTEDDRKKSKEAGFDYHLTKPAGFAEVQDILNSMPNHTRNELTIDQA
ncbi:MAG: PAS domain S-box protein [Gammaproteobacteria bacterium]|nr:MAG: PAS domain S-box protein [Gammaproteobacteria bacterium]